MEKDPKQYTKMDSVMEEIFYFKFEQDFIERSIRCIPMIVRFKMDHAGIKLKLEEWTRFSLAERLQLARIPIGNRDEITHYHDFLDGLVRKHTGKPATTMMVDPFPVWSELQFVPVSIQEKLGELGCSMPVEKWQSLTTLQRFALVKLSREGHESKNFPIALKEFGLL